MSSSPTQSEGRFFYSCDALSHNPTGFCNTVGCNAEGKCLVKGLNPKLKPLDKQEGGDHYKLPIQPVDFIVKNGLGFREGNVIKYVTRHGRKHGASDIRKAIHYLEMILEDYE